MNGNQSLQRLVFSLIIAALPTHTYAQTFISEEALFYRCYGQLTQTRPKFSDPLLAQVKSGAKTALQACTEVFDSARFTANDNTKIADDNNAAAKATLQTFHQLHRSWARDRIILRSDSQSTITTTGTNAWHDDSPMGAYITRALFSPSHDLTSILNGSDFPQPVRTTMDPPKISNGVPNAVSTLNPTDWMFGANQPFAPRGELLGIRTVSLPPVAVQPAVPIGNAMPNFDNIGVAPTTTQSWSTINFLDVASLSAPISQTTQFAIRARGNLQIPTEGSYTFFIDADDVGALIIDKARVTAARTTGTPITLSAGTHQFEIQYLQRTTTARLIFSWQGPNITTRQVIPASALNSVNAEYYIQSQPAPVTFTNNEGGGFIGNHNYLLTTFGEPDVNFVPDGQLRTNRNFPRAVIHDTLCREIPVIREVDAQPFVAPTSTSPFRQEAACVTCHATTDRLAGGAIRGLRWNLVPEVNRLPPLPDLYGIADVKMIKPTLAENTEWSAIVDPDYAIRAPYGHFYFRNYRGELVNQVIRSIPELAAVISAQDDYYTCFAKRYYRYFLGIDVPLYDPGDPSTPRLNFAEEHHKAKIIALGLKLKEHKNLRQLVLDIINSEEYKMADFGIAYGGPNNG